MMAQSAAAMGRQQVKRVKATKEEEETVSAGET